MRAIKEWGIMLTVLGCQHALPFTAFAAEPRPESATQAPASEEAAASVQLEPLLVDVLFNRRSTGAQLCYRLQDEYWVPFALFLEQSGLQAPEIGKGRISFETTLGTITFDSGSVKLIDRTLCISLSELKKTFLVAGRFNQSAFAIELDVPWHPGRPESHVKKTEPVIPDIKAPGSSLSFLRFEPEITWDFDATPEKNLFFEAGGRVFGGVWDITLEGDPEQSFIPTRYHWTAFSRNLAIRLGTGSSDIYPLIDDESFTGLQFGWNNHNILNQLDFERYSDSDVFLSLDRTQQRSIEGSGPPAAIAELRLDGVVAARQRIGLDGRFRFSNVRMTSDLRKTEVWLFERSLREKPLAILDYTISIMNRSLPAGEILIRGGGGVTGNPLDQSDEPGRLTGFGHIMYGLGNRITLEGGVQHNPDNRSADLMLGSVVSFGGNWAAALYGARSNGRYGADVRLEGHGKHWDVSALSSWQESGFSSDDTERTQDHSLRFSAGILEPFDMLLYGRYSRTGDGEIRKFLLPGLYWTVAPWLMFSALPDDDEKYRYETTLRLGSRSDLSVVYEKQTVTGDWRFDFSRSLIGRFMHSYATKTGDQLSSLYLDWYPGGSRFDLIRLGASRSGSEIGYSAAWSKFINAGLRFSLQYSYNMNNAHQLDTEENFIEDFVETEARHFASFTMTWDMGFSKKRAFPVNRSAISHTRGGLAGSLNIMNDTRLGSSDINDVDILLNGRKLGQRQIDGTFFVGNLRPGVYSVDIDTEKLPLELNVSRNSVKVEVRNGAVTEVNIPVYAEFGVAGCLSDSRGNGVAGVLLEIIDASGAPAGKAITDQFGYYRVDKLRSGTYTLKTPGGESSQQKTFTIAGDFVFDVNLTTP